MLNDCVQTLNLYTSTMERTMKLCTLILLRSRWREKPHSSRKREKLQNKLIRPHPTTREKSHYIFVRLCPSGREKSRSTLICLRPRGKEKHEKARWHLAICG